MNYKKTFRFGKIAFYGKRKVNEVEVEVEYNDKNGKPRFSAIGEVWNANHTHIVCGGQCLDTLNEFIGNNEIFKRIYGQWKRNHLNDMDACANDTQRKAVNEYMASHNNRYDYDGVCQYLKDKGCYTVKVDGKDCVYGAEWYFRPISKEDDKDIRNLLG